MPKRAKLKTAGQVHQLKRVGNHPVGGVAGLCIQVKESGAKSWILRTTIAGKRREIGLGPFPEVSLSVARDKAGDMKEAIRNGRDPAEERREAQRALAAAQAQRITFDEAVRRYMPGKRHELRDPKSAQQWEHTLSQYASPVIGDMAVQDITINHVVDVLMRDDLWTQKTETAARLRGRIEAVLAWATASGYREGDNPARWRGNLDAVLPKPSRISKVQHHRALPVEEVGQFMVDLRQRDGMAARALEFTILTAARSGEVRGATWEEIDLDAKTWTIPAERMKANKAHRVPLSGDAVALLKALPRFEGSPYVFPAPRGGMLSDMSLTGVMKRMEVDATVHGFRSTFRDWCSEHTAYANEVIEQALAHTISNAVERAYRRGDLLAKRARLMADWAKFCGTVQKKADVRSIGEATG